MKSCKETLWTSWLHTSQNLHFLRIKYFKGLVAFLVNLKYYSVLESVNRFAAGC